MKPDDQPTVSGAPLVREWGDTLGAGTARFPWLVAILALLAQGALFWKLLQDRGGALLDDAYISFRYAARWAEGLGVTWNDGVPVEGFSNPLWTYLLGGGARLGVPPHLLAPPFGLVTLFGTTVVLRWIARKRRLGRVATSWLVLAAGCDVGLALWAGSGLETAGAACLVALWIAVAAGIDKGRAGFARGVALGLLGAGLWLSRPEGALWSLAGLSWLVWGAWAPPRLLAGWCLGMIPTGGYLAYRIATFGTIVPNTFFAKVEAVPGAAGHGLDDLLAWVSAHAVFLVVVLGSAGRARGARSTERGPARWKTFLAGLVVLQGGFVVAAGGDWMGSTRYMAPVLPAFYLLGAEFLRDLPALRRRALTLLPAGVALHLAVGWLTRDTIPDYTRVGRVLGEWLGEVALPGETLAVTAAGAIPYFSGLPTLDVLGINDPEVAGRPARHVGPWTPGHHRYDLDALLEAEPDWIVWDFGVRLNRNRLRHFAVLGGDPDTLDYRRALLARERFRDRYTIESAAPEGTQDAYTVFRRR